jgi:hypothetical protein
MSATLLRLTPAVREAVKDARAIERRLRDGGATWGPALGKARERIADLARVRDWRKPEDEQ